MVLLESLKVPLGSPAIDFRLEDMHGTECRLEDYRSAKVLAIVFMCNHCPYVQAVWSRLNALQEKYQHQGVQFVGINPNVDHADYADESAQRMPEYAQKYGMNFPYLKDPTQETAKAYRAQCTPDIFVYDQERKLVYHGRVDDSWKDAEKATQHDLDYALSLLAAGKPAPDIQPPSMGCSIKWRE